MMIARNINSAIGLASIKSGAAALRNFNPANVGSNISLSG
jgi:hypothetical protein